MEGRTQLDDFLLEFLAELLKEIYVILKHLSSMNPLKISQTESISFVIIPSFMRFQKLLVSTQSDPFFSSLYPSNYFLCEPILCIQTQSEHKIEFRKGRVKSRIEILINFMVHSNHIILALFVRSIPKIHSHKYTRMYHFCT